MSECADRRSTSPAPAEKRDVKALEPLDVRDAGPTHRHPWMGPFNALQWTWLLAGHSGIRLAQIQAIKKGF